MLNFECPKCKKETEIEGEQLPDCACEDEEWECLECGYETKIGWYATVEER